jgi:hypothetical protein
MAPPVGGYYAWYDATQIAAVADGTVLTNWPDLSGNSRHLNDHVGTPTYYKTTTAKLINGNPTVYFNKDGFMRSTVAFSQSQPVTVFIVARLDDPTFTSHTLILYGTDVVLFSNSTGHWTIQNNTNVTDGSSDLNFHVFAALYNGVSSLLRADGTQILTGDAGSNGFAGNVLYVGALNASATTPWQGPVGEMIIYPSGLTTPQIQSVESYLTAKWSSPPAVNGTASLTLGPLTLTGSVPSAAIPLGPLAVAASGTVANPVGFANFSLDINLVASGLTGGCTRRAWLTLGPASLPLEDSFAGYFCQNLDLGYPAVREVVNNRPDRDGLVDRTQLMGSRVVSAYITAVAGAAARIDAVAASFAPFMAPSARPVLHYILDRPGTPERTLVLRGAGYSWLVAGPAQRDIQLQWVAADPVARDPLVRTVAASPVSVGTISSPGDVAVYPLIRVYGPITSAVVQLAPAGLAPTWLLAFKTGLVIGVGHFVEIDTSARTVYSDGDPARPALSNLDWTRTSWQWIDPAPSSSAMSLTGTATSAATQVTATWQDGYLT